MNSIKKVFFTLITILIFFCLAEIVSRLIYPFWYKRYKQQILEEEAVDKYMRDPVLGWILTPNFKGSLSTKDKISYHKTNSLGLRDEEFPFEKTKSTFRMICLGDSITEGSAVDYDKTYPKLLEKKFKDYSSEIKIEIINAGIGDYCIEQEYILLKERLLKYHPDMVILGYYLNDARGFVPSKAITFKGYRDLVNKSRFLYLIDKAIMKYKIKYQYKLWEKDRCELWEPVYKKGEWRADKEIRHNLISLSERDWGLAWTAKGWKKTEAYLDMFLSLSKRNEFKFVVVCFPVTVQLYADESDSYMFIPQERLRNYCQDKGINFIDPLAHLKKFKESEVLFDQCHYTDFGLGVIAGIIHNSLKNEINPKG